MLTAGVAQSIALARALGVDPQEFFEVIAGGPLDSPYARAKGGLIMSGEYPVSFALSGAVKDGRLIQSALRSADVSDRLMAAVTETLEEAVRPGSRSDRARHERRHRGAHRRPPLSEAGAPSCRRAGTTVGSCFTRRRCTPTGSIIIS